MTPDLRIACETVFQEHKQSAQPIKWTRDSFRGRISFGLCEMAKETLVKRNIILISEKSKKTFTQLNPDATGANSFEEAEKMIGDKMNLVVNATPPVTTINVSSSETNKTTFKAVDSTASHIYISKAPADAVVHRLPIVTVAASHVTVAGAKAAHQTAAGIYVAKAPVDVDLQGDDMATVSFMAPAKKLTAIMTVPESEPHKGKWWLKPVFLYLVWPVCGAAGGVLLSLFMNFAYTQLFLHAK